MVQGKVSREGVVSGRKQRNKADEVPGLGRTKRKAGERIGVNEMNTILVAITAKFRKRDLIK